MNDFILDVAFQVDLIENITFPDNQFDVVLSSLISTWVTFFQPLQVHLGPRGFPDQFAHTSPFEALPVLVAFVHGPC